jgi:hypothetical protein
MVYLLDTPFTKVAVDTVNLATVPRALPNPLNRTAAPAYYQFVSTSIPDPATLERDDRLAVAGYALLAVVFIASIALI